MRVWVCALVLAISACAESDQARNSQTANHLLTQNGTPDFADASTAKYAAIRHTPSGMICKLPPSGAFQFELFPPTSANAGAQCSSSEGEVVTAWVAVSFREPTTLDIAFSNALAELTNGMSVQPWRGQPSEADRASPEGLPHYRIHCVRANFDGEERYLRLSMAEMDGWYLQQIVSGPLSEAPAAEDVTGVSWRAGLQAFAEARREQAEAAR